MSMCTAEQPEQPEQRGESGGRAWAETAEWSRPPPVASGPGGRRRKPSLSACVVTGAIGLAAAAAIVAPVGFSPTTAAQACKSTIRKVAAPETVAIGDQARITLTVLADCSRLQVPMHVALVFDNSVHMGGRRMADMKASVAAFVDEVDFGSSRVGLTAYFGRVERLIELTDDGQAVVQASQRFFPREGSDLTKALRAGRQMLEQGRSLAVAPDVQEVIVLLVGSSNEGGTDELLREAALARDEGMLIVAVAAGSKADLRTLEAIVTGPTFLYFEGTSSRLPSLFRRIAGDLTAVHVAAAEIVDSVPENMPYVWGSGVPAPRVREGVMRWRYDVWPEEGITITFAVEPTELGCHPTNVAAEAMLRLDRGSTLRRVFAVPTVCVVPPATDTPIAPTPTRVPTESPPSAPLYLPFVWNRHCRPAARRADAVLVFDTSSSMLSPAVDGRPRLDLAIEAASYFLDALTLPDDRVSVVSFGRRVEMVATLTGDLGALRVSLASLARNVGDGTQLAAALDAAGRELRRVEDIGSKTPVVIVLTDDQDAGPAALEAAERLRAAGVHVYAIGLGRAVSLGFLSDLAGRARRASVTVDGALLGDVYVGIAREIACGLEPQP